MFEWFTEGARRVVVLAQEEARTLGHNYIGTEHILLGLIRESASVAARTLESLGISLEAVRQQVEEITGTGQEQQRGHIPFTPQAKKAIELSLRESQQLGHSYIGTEHILLGLIREGEGVAAQVLVRQGADLHRARQQVIALLLGYQGEQPVSPRTAPPQGSRTTPPPGGGRLLTVREAAEIMHVSKMAVYRLVHDGELHGIRAGRSFQIPEEALRLYLGLD
jgi:ATP-dependent Clp protease ATP-binding subunit ClpC